jgi:hypothetical protein
MKPDTPALVPARRDTLDGVDAGRPILLALFTRPMADSLRVLLHPTSPVECFEGNAPGLIEWLAQPPARWLLLPPTHGDDIGIGPVVVQLSAIDPPSFVPWITIVLSDSSSRGRHVLEAVRAGASVVRLSELPDLVKSGRPPLLTLPRTFAEAPTDALAGALDDLEETLTFLITDSVALSILRDALDTKPAGERSLSGMSPDGVRRHLRTLGLPSPSRLLAWGRLLRSASMCTYGLDEESSARACGFISRRTMRRTACRLLHCDDGALPSWTLAPWMSAFHRHVVFGLR